MNKSIIIKLLIILVLVISANNVALANLNTIRKISECRKLDSSELKIVVLTNDIQCKACFEDLLEFLSGLKIKNVRKNIFVSVLIKSNSDSKLKRERELQILMRFPFVSKIDFINSENYTNYEQFSSQTGPDIFVKFEIDHCPALLIYPGSENITILIKYEDLFDETRVTAKAKKIVLAILKM